MYTAKVTAFQTPIEYINQTNGNMGMKQCQNYVHFINSAELHN